MKRKIIAIVAFACLLVGGLLTVWQLQQTIDRERQSAHLKTDILALRSPGVVKKLSLEYAPLMGAVYWTRAVQYYGEKHILRDPNLELLWPLLDIATTLDPNLIVAYRFGSIFLSDAPPRGAGRPDLAVRLLERGLNANPNYWRLYQDLGNVYYFDAKDYAKASRAFEQGSKNPEAAPWMRIMAAKVAAEGGSLQTSYFLWQQVYQTTTDSQIKKNAETHLKLVKTELDCQAVDNLVDEFERHTGHRATTINELIQAGLLKGLPADPDGYTYVLGEGGKAELNVNSPLLEEKLLDERFRGNK